MAEMSLNFSMSDPELAGWFLVYHLSLPFASAILLPTAPTLHSYLCTPFIVTQVKMYVKWKSLQGDSSTPY